MTHSGAARPARESEPDGQRASAAVTPEPGPPGRRRMVFIVVGVVALALIGAGTRRWWFGRSHVTTDNAQVDGHIIPVLPKTGGFVAEIRVAENQKVKAGDTLVVLDDRDLQVRLNQAEAELGAMIATVGTRGRVGQSVAQLSAAKASAAAAVAAVSQAEANATRANNDYERYRVLGARNIVSSQQLDAADAGARAANAQLTAARQSAQAADEQVLAATAALRGADARVAAARAARDQAALQLSYTRVTAPSDGVVSRKSAEVGQLVQAGQPLMSVVPTEDVWVVANLKETETRDVTTGDAAEIEVDAYPGVHFAGHVESLSPATGAKFSLLPPDNATGNFTKVVQRVPVRIRLDEAQDPAHLLRPGMSVSVTVTTH